METQEASPQQRTFIVQVIHSIEEVSATEWNAVAIGSGEVNPFVLHAFLLALEISKSAVKETGWAPHHLLVREEGSDQVLGCCPLYLKVHSYGEYIFDHSWNGLAMRLGQNYYPKLQSCVPFSPVGGPRLMVRRLEDRSAVTQALAKAIVRAVDDSGISSAHITFNQREEWDSPELAGLGWLQRSGIQCHWENRGYTSFEDFLSTLRTSKRKTIRQERKSVATSGLKVRRLSGDDLKPMHWDQFHQFYLNTVDSKWAQAYLTKDFFQQLGDELADRCMLVVAQEGNKNSPLVAGALNLVGSEAIYGRNWGCSDTCPRVKHLHFELCYYSAQDEAIERGLKRVEAGAQGQETKIPRGYLPSKTYSSHYIRDPVFRSLLERHLQGEQQAIDYNLAVLNEIASPFKKPTQ